VVPKMQLVLDRPWMQPATRPHLAASFALPRISGFDTDIRGHSTGPVSRGFTRGKNGHVEFKLYRAQAPANLAQYTPTSASRLASAVSAAASLPPTATISRDPIDLLENSRFRRRLRSALQRLASY